MVEELEPFVTATKVVETGLFPGLTKEKLRHYVRQGFIRAYGPAKSKTYLLSEVHEAWSNIGRKLDGYEKVSQRPQAVGSRLQKAWRKV